MSTIIKAHTSIIGETGYNCHSQNFFTELAKLYQVQVRNWTVGTTWQGQSDEPHNDEYYMTDSLKTMLVSQTLSTATVPKDFPIYTSWKNEGIANVHIVLNDNRHPYFGEKFEGPSIAYNVWETTRQPAEFFEKLKRFDQVWVPSEWQAKCTIEQGISPHKVKVVPEGVNPEMFKPVNRSTNFPEGRPFRFVVVGRWEYRKSTKEIIKAFCDTFSEAENVELVIRVENRFATDGCINTEQRLAKWGFTHSGIKPILKHLSKEEYVKLLQNSDVFVSCARGEGWNLPLIEAMATGLPSLYSDWGAQLEFAEGRGIPVKIISEVSASVPNSESWDQSAPGNFAEPDFMDLCTKLRDSYENFEKHKAKALADSAEIRVQFDWAASAETAQRHIQELLSPKDSTNLSDYATVNHVTLGSAAGTPQLSVNFVDGPFVELSTKSLAQYTVEFVDSKTSEVHYTTRLQNGHWGKASAKYYKDWLIRVLDSFGNCVNSVNLDLSGKRVYIPIESNSLGDTIAWFPYVEEFRKKHNCEVICSTFWNQLFQPNYPTIDFVVPGMPVDNLYAMYKIGWYHTSDNQVDRFSNPSDFKLGPLQKTSSDILGLDFSEIKPIVSYPKKDRLKKVGLGINSTAQSKYWNNPTGWQEVTDWLIENGYEPVILSREEDGYMGNTYPTGATKFPAGSIDHVISELAECKAFIGISSGLTWLAWVTDTPTFQISGFTESFNEPNDGIVKISAPVGSCSGCANRLRLDAGDWNWCPDHKGTDRQFECSRKITADQVINELKKILI